VVQRKEREIIIFMTARTVRFCFTLNNWTDVDIQWFDDSTMFKYVCYGKEIGANLTPHLQGYFEFPNRQTKSVAACVKTLIDGGLVSRPHIEIAKGTADQCIVYCQKEGVFWEKGEKPKGQGKRVDLDAVYASITNGDSLQDVACSHPTEFIKFHRGIERLIAIRQPKRNWKTEVYWLWGPSGTGKSRWAWETYPDAYMKQAGTKWWCGYSDQACAIIDDFRPSKELPFNFILSLFDRYPLLLEVKGGSTQCLLKTICVTSPFSPDQMLLNLDWVGMEAGLQLKRRLDHVIQFPQLAMMFSEISQTQT